MAYTAAEQRLYDEYVKAGKAIERKALSDFLSVYDIGSETDPAKMLKALVPIYQRYVQMYGAAQAALAADFYDEMRAVAKAGQGSVGSAVTAVAAARFTAVPAEVAPPDALAKNVAFAVQSMYTPGAGGGPDAVQGRLEGALLRQVRNAGRDTIIESAQAEIRRTGKGPKYARVLRGEQNCQWCITLASRGAVFASADTARRQMTKQLGLFHDKCDCEIVLIRSDHDWPAGYDLRAVEAMYAQVKADRAAASQRAAARRAEKATTA